MEESIHPPERTSREYVNQLNETLSFHALVARNNWWLAVYNHWTGLVDWTGGLDWWTGLVD